MRKFRQALSAPVVSGLFFVLAAALLLGSAIGGTRAALSHYSDPYNTEVELSQIGVSLLENGTAVSGNDAILKTLLDDGKQLVPGKRYDEKLSASNDGDMDEFVRVSVYKYWEDSSGAKRPDLDSSLIELGFVTGSGWTIDPSASTEERTVLYYGKALSPGESTSPFMESITINGEIMRMAEQVTEEVDGLTTITTIYTYDGARFRVCAYVDAVQTHSGEAAVKSAWGTNVSVSGDSLTLK